MPHFPAWKRRNSGRCYYTAERLLSMLTAFYSAGITGQAFLIIIFGACSVMSILQNVSNPRLMVKRVSVHLDNLIVLTVQPTEMCI